MEQQKHRGQVVTGESRVNVAIRSARVWRAALDYILRRVLSRVGILQAKNDSPGQAGALMPFFRYRIPRV